MTCIILHPKYPNPIRHGITITTRAAERHFLIKITTVRQPTKRRGCYFLQQNTPFIGERDKEFITTP